MTKLNQQVLDECHREHLDEQAAKEFREWVIYSAPEDVRSVLNRYEEKMLKRQDEYLKAKLIQEWATFVLFFVMICYGLYATVTPVLNCK